MAPGPSTLLSLALCLAQTARTQQGTLPRPSISAEPGSVVPWGRPVSIVCRGPAGVTSFRLEKGNRKAYEDVGVTSRGEQETEARFHITTLSEDAVGPYRCIYQIESSWSALSEALSLEGTAEAVSALPAAPFSQESWCCPGLREGHEWPAVGCSGWRGARLRGTDPGQPLHSTSPSPVPPPLQDPLEASAPPPLSAASPLLPQACRQSRFIFSLGSLCPFSFVSPSWSFSSSIVSSGENEGLPEAKTRRRDFRGGSAQLWMSEMGPQLHLRELSPGPPRIQMWPALTDFLTWMERWAP
ncbi:leukocyte-associated immunoglobulin-like receptor 1 isoform X5 [Ovis canadensis]